MIAFSRPVRRVFIPAPDALPAFRTKKVAAAAMWGQPRGRRFFSSNARGHIMHRVQGGPAV